MIFISSPFSSKVDFESWQAIDDPAERLAAIAKAWEDLGAQKRAAAPPSLAMPTRKQRATPTRHATPYDRPPKQRTAASSSSGGEDLSEATTRHRRRTSFGEATVELFIDERGVGLLGQVQERLRPAEGSLYYPASPKNKAAGHELAKVRRKPAGRSEPFCECTDRCSKACPCIEGLGCQGDLLHDGTWWGCGCEGKCQSGIDCYVFDAAAVDKARKAKLRAARMGLET